jgi:hypothetical protein
VALQCLCYVQLPMSKPSPALTPECLSMPLSNVPTLLSFPSPQPTPLLPTPATKVDHDVSISVMDARKSQRGHIAPHLEGPSEGIIHCLWVQVRCVANDPGRDRKACEHACSVQVLKCVCMKCTCIIAWGVHADAHV